MKRYMLVASLASAFSYSCLAMGHYVYCFPNALTKRIATAYLEKNEMAKTEVLAYKAEEKTILYWGPLKGLSRVNFLAVLTHAQQKNCMHLQKVAIYTESKKFFARVPFFVVNAQQLSELEVEGTVQASFTLATLMTLRRLALNKKDN